MASSIQQTSSNVLQSNHVALVTGASRGIGLAFVVQLLEQGATVYASARQATKSAELRQLASATRGRLIVLNTDVTIESQLMTTATQIQQTCGKLDLVINSAGMLHEAGQLPEKKLQQLSLENLQRAFAINTFAPILLAKHLWPLLRGPGRCVFASLSARVGSIGDNRLGGWYSYRASKTAQNQLLKTLAIELARVNPAALVLSLHPGTTDTQLSKPFQQQVRHPVFSTERAARQLLQVIAAKTPADSGQFFAWDGTSIPW